MSSNSNLFGEKTNLFGENSNLFGENSNLFGKKSNSFGENSNLFGWKLLWVRLGAKAGRPAARAQAPAMQIHKCCCIN